MPSGSQAKKSERTKHKDDNKRLYGEIIRVGGKKTKFYSINQEDIEQIFEENEYILEKGTIFGIMDYVANLPISLATFKVLVFILMRTNFGRREEFNNGEFTGEFYFSPSNIAKYNNLSLNSAKKAIKELKRLGILIKIGEKGRQGIWIPCLEQIINHAGIGFWEENQIKKSCEKSDVKTKFEVVCERAYYRTELTGKLHIVIPELPETSDEKIKELKELTKFGYACYILKKDDWIKFNEDNLAKISQLADIPRGEVVKIIKTGKNNCIERQLWQSEILAFRFNYYDKTFSELDFEVVKTQQKINLDEIFANDLEVFEVDARSWEEYDKFFRNSKNK